MTTPLPPEHRETEDLLRAALDAHRRATVVPPLPDMARLRAGAAAPPGRTPRTLLRTVAAAAVAAAVVTGVIVAVGNHPVTPATLPAAPASPAGAGPMDGDRAPDAATVLRKLAAAAEAAPSTPPRPEQLNYGKTIYRAAAVDPADPAEPHPTGPQPADATVTSEVWTPELHTDVGLIRRTNGKVTVEFPYATAGDAVAAPDLGTYAGLAALPTRDAGPLLAAVNTYDRPLPGDTTATRTLRSLSQQNLLVRVLPPAFAAGLYRALAGLPGLSTTPVTDLAGRAAVAVGATDRAGYRYEMLVDPRAHTVLGSREYPVATGPRDYAPGPGTDGRSTFENAVLAVGTVDRPGELPR